MNIAGIKHVRSGGESAVSGAEPFDYDRAFARNIGLVSEEEQRRLRGLHVGIPGLGGVGGIHLMTLARMGIECFHLADPDVFEVSNVQRQFGATIPSLGRNKTEAMAAAAREINPGIRTCIFADGVT
ncbi:MAG: ThiF family adenylyltransferase, partial [Planctomycetota bacterium]|nr:ThiF family adenylyltransferase [Planctomycetota bacterium]